MLEFRRGLALGSPDFGGGMMVIKNVNIDAKPADAPPPSPPSGGNEGISLGLIGLLIGIISLVGGPVVVHWSKSAFSDVDGNARQFVALDAPEEEMISAGAHVRRDVALRWQVLRGRVAPIHPQPGAYTLTISVGEEFLTVPAVVERVR